MLGARRSAGPGDVGGDWGGVCWERLTWRLTDRSPPFPSHALCNVQMAVLNNTAAEDLGDQDALEAALEAELAAAEDEADEAAAGAPTPASKKKVGGQVGAGVH